MVINAMMRWVDTAVASERARAAHMIAGMVGNEELSSEDRRNAEQALVLLLDDPSPKVRQTMAVRLAYEPKAPLAVIHALARDQASIAGPIVLHSPVLGDADLIDIITEAPDRRALVLAERRGLSRAVSATIAECGGPDAVLALLSNETAQLASITLERIASRFASELDIRDALVSRPDLPTTVRHSLVLATSDTLAGNAFIKNAIGEARLARVTREACQTATLDLVDTVSDEDMPALVEHLRLQKQMTVALLMGSLCLGRLNFYASALSALSGQALPRVRALIVDGRVPAIRALYGKIGLSSGVTELFISATTLWRETRRHDQILLRTTIAEKLIDRHGHEAAHDRDIAALLMLVRRIGFSEQRRIAREEARSALAGPFAA